MNDDSLEPIIIHTEIINDVGNTVRVSFEIPRELKDEVSFESLVQTARDNISPMDEAIHITIIEIGYAEPMTFDMLEERHLNSFVILIPILLFYIIKFALYE